MNDIQKVITAFSAIFFVSILVGLVISWFVMVLWNHCLVPAISVAHQITWLQSWGISVLSGLLFKSSSTSK